MRRFPTNLVWVLLLAGVILAEIPHQHRTKDIRHFNARVLEIDRGQIVFVDLEEDPNEIVAVHRVDVDKDFRLIEFRESSDASGGYHLLGLGALKGSIGVLNICDGCHKAIGMRIGNVNFYK